MLHTVCLLEDTTLIANRNSESHQWDVTVQDNLTGKTVKTEMVDRDYALFLALIIDGDDDPAIRNVVGDERYARFEALFKDAPEVRPFP